MCGCCEKVVGTTTQPIGGPTGHAVFLNGAVLVETSLDPAALHQRLKALEVAAGRRQTMQWAARPLDIDLLIYEDVVLQTRQLEVPHPRMAFRRFVLEPAAEIAPDLTHPVIRWTMQRLLDHLNSAIPYLAITSATTARNIDLAQSVAKEIQLVLSLIQAPRISIQIRLVCWWLRS